MGLVARRPSAPTMARVLPWPIAAPAGLPRIPALIHHRASAAVIGVGVAFAVAQVVGLTPQAFDAGAYWAARSGALYQADWGAASGRAAYLYSPAFATALEPFRLLPELVFTGIWQLLLFTVLALVLRAWAAVLVVAATAAIALGISGPDIVVVEILHGNIHVLLGAVAVLGVRHPSLWAFALLTKVTPGIGVLWFAARAEWRAMGVALGATLVILAGSLLVQPGDWSDWVAFLAANNGREPAYWVVPIALPVRLAMSAALTWWGARTDRPWVLPIAVGWALPIPHPTMLAVMVFAVAAWNRTQPPSLASLTAPQASRSSTVGTRS